MVMAGNTTNGAEMPEYLRPEIVPFLKLLTEATRARPQGVPGAFIRPAGTDQAEADYHHFIFGQRESGKSSLLRYLENLMTQEHRISVWIDQEVFTDLAYPDVLVSCVLEITDKLALRTALGGKVCLKTAAMLPHTWQGKAAFWWP
jgi:hypothetical protein